MSNQNNNKVRFLHYREPQFDEGDNIVVSSRGGATVAYVQGEAGTTYAIAYCHERDNYSKNLGRIKSEGLLHSKTRSETSHITERDEFIEWMDDSMLDSRHLFRKNKKAHHVQE